MKIHHLPVIVLFLTAILCVIEISSGVSRSSRSPRLIGNTTQVRASSGTPSGGTGTEPGRQAETLGEELSLEAEENTLRESEGVASSRSLTGENDLAVMLSSRTRDTLKARAEDTSAMESSEPPEEAGFEEMPPTEAETRRTGFFTENGVAYFYDEQGNPYNGWRYEETGRAHYKNGVRQTGYCYIEGRYWYLNDRGNPEGGWKWLASGRYWFGSEGVSAEGWLDQDGERYYISGYGRALTGYQTIGGKLYYFTGEGRLVRNADVGEYRADASGVLTSRFTEITEGNLDEYVQILLGRIGRTPQNIYLYVKKNFAFREKNKLSVREMAIRMLNTGSGSCYDYAALAIVLLNGAGYEARLVVGESRTASEHDWVLYQPSPGVWRHMDPYRSWLAIYNMTDEQLEKYDNYRGCTYLWDRNEWTSTTGTGRGGAPAAVTTEAETTTEPATSATSGTTPAAASSSPQETAQPTTQTESASEPTQPEETTTAPDETTIPPTAPQETTESEAASETPEETTQTPSEAESEAETLPSSEESGSSSEETNP